MAAIPLTFAIPAAAVSLAYLNARISASTDLSLLRASISGASYIKRAERTDRVNVFYELEKHALSSNIGHRPFIAIPPSVSKTVQSLNDLEGLACVEYTYKQVYNLSLQFAAWLKLEHGVQKGDIIALDFTNKPQFVFLWFAIWSLGAKPAFINTGLRGKALLHCVETSSSRLLLLDPDLQNALTPEVQARLSDTRVGAVVVNESVEIRVRNTPGYHAPHEDRGGEKGNDLAVLIFTSGTTGLPKASIVPWRKLLNSAKAMGVWLGIEPKDRYYTAMPLYHTSAALLGLATSLFAGATLIISHHFSPQTFFASATASKATMMQYIGEMCRYLVSMPPSLFDRSHNIRLAFGNGLRPDVWQIFKERFAITEIAEFYSATEAVGGSFVKSKNNFGLGAVGRTGTVLRTLTGSATAIVKHDVDTGEPWRDPKTGLCERVKVGESGEHLAQLDPTNVADKYVGYFKNKKASQSKVLRDVLRKGDAWYRSGDLLKRDDEGRLFFVDRIGDTFRWKSENVSTNEVAEAISSSPHVGEINVYGVQLPNHDGRAGCAALVLKAQPDDATMTAIAQHARQKLPKFAVPLFLRVVKQFEVTGTNKYTKHGLRTQGVDPEQTGDDAVFWLPANATGYESFGKRQWDGIIGGGVKL
ncbi:hypothetical protein BDV97DRAFT_332198 [Delphinella strobiligena]|nr:hypothetical protein BDV97DRAFT_332198 [Delphinella strobiligena]